MMATVTTDYVSLDVGGSSMEAFVARPETPGREEGPGMLVLQEAYGVNKHIRDVAERYARLGFTAIAPELFHRTAPPHFEAPYGGDFGAIQPHFSALTPQTLIDDMSAAYDWLAEEAKIDAKRIAAVGYCMGGRCAYLANAELPLGAAISYYGGGIAPDLLDRAKKQGSPILMFWGGLDKHIPPEQYRAVADALTAAGADHVQVVFSKADHAFNRNGGLSYNEAAAREALHLVLEFLRVNGVLD
jgi:carboxymethylenebutenolidase